jgi:hypothetical protein
VVTSLGSESVTEYVVEDRILRKETMSFAIGALISQVVERGQLIFCYSPLSANLIPHKVIMSDANIVGNSITQTLNWWPSMEKLMVDSYPLPLLQAVERN